MSRKRSYMGWLLGHDRRKIWAFRGLALLTVVFGVNYVTWRYLASINWDHWYISVPLLVAETVGLLSLGLFILTHSSYKKRAAPPPPLDDCTIDVFITTYNEPLDVVAPTIRAARAIEDPVPHGSDGGTESRVRVYLLDDGNREEMRELARSEGVEYLTRSADWYGHDRNAKAGNLNNALLFTSGEYILILDADQAPRPQILRQTIGYFRDPEVAIVQTPQWFRNVPEKDPYGAQVPLFYGPIQQGKDGWNAAMFCGSNAVLRREALLRVGLQVYTDELEQRVVKALGRARHALKRARQNKNPERPQHVAMAIIALERAVERCYAALHDGESLQEATGRFRDRAREISFRLIEIDQAALLPQLRELPETASDELVEQALQARDALANRDTLPLAAMEEVRDLLRVMDIDRPERALPVMPITTISVTEDAATSLRLARYGWRTIYHHEVLVEGLAPEDLESSLQQRLRWAQGSLQMLFRDCPLRGRGLSPAQRLLYLETMTSYFGGFIVLVYILAPVLYLTLGLRPLDTYSSEFYLRFLPYFFIGQLMALAVGYGIPTWRGHQHNLTLFPIWITATWTAIANVFFGRKLGFVVTPKKRGPMGIHPRVIWPQLAVIGVSFVALGIGAFRLGLGTGEPGAVTVNMVWTTYNLALLSVVFLWIRASRTPLAEHPSGFDAVSQSGRPVDHMIGASSASEENKMNA